MGGRSSKVFDDAMRVIQELKNQNKIYQENVTELQEQLQHLVKKDTNANKILFHIHKTCKVIDEICNAIETSMKGVKKILLTSPSENKEAEEAETEILLNVHEHIGKLKILLETHALFGDEKFFMTSGEIFDITRNVCNHVVYMWIIMQKMFPGMSNATSSMNKKLIDHIDKSIQGIQSLMADSKATWGNRVVPISFLNAFITSMGNNPSKFQISSSFFLNNNALQDFKDLIKEWMSLDVEVKFEGGIVEKNTFIYSFSIKRNKTLRS